MAEFVFTDDNFETEVLKSKLPVLVDFYADWCGPCKMLAPILEELGEKYSKKWRIGKLNVDENPNTSMKYGVQSIPTLLFVKNGEVVDHMIGFHSKEAIEEKLK